MNWNVNDTAQKKYLMVCRDAAMNDDAFLTFKTHPHYTAILEHTSQVIGNNYLKLVKKNNPSLLELKYDPSPTGLQYLGVLSNLMDLCGPLDGLKIIEIGGGYGGQCKIINDIFRPECYHIIDLYEPTLLQNRYLKGYNFQTFTDNYPLMEYNLAISNYALSEITEPKQSEYVDQILMRSAHGYLTCNGVIHQIELLKNKFPELTITPDIEGERKENFKVIW